MELRSRASVGEIVGAAIETRATTGATKELQDELGLNANQVPLDLLVEQRASTVTAAPTDGEETSQRIVPAVFPDSVAGFLRVDQPRVPAGVASWYVLTTNLTANTPVAGAAGPNTAAAFTSRSLEPGRAQGAFVVRREDVARFPGMESALRENLSNALMDKLDREVIRGSGGLLNDGLTQPSVPGSTVEFDGYTDLLAERVDGLYASTTGSVRLLVGAKTYQHAIEQYRADRADDPSALQYLMDLAGGVRVGYHIAEPATSGGRANVQDVLAARATGLVHMVQPVWEGPTAVVDPYRGRARARSSSPWSECSRRKLFARTGSQDSPSNLPRGLRCLTCSSAGPPGPARPLPPDVS